MRKCSWCKYNRKEYSDFYDAIVCFCRPHTDLCENYKLKWYLWWRR